MSTPADGVDVHAHGVPRKFLEHVRKTRLGGVNVEVAEGRYVVTFPGEAALRPCAGIMLHFSERLEWLDRQGMRQQLLGTWLDVDGQKLAPPDGQEWVRQLNDAMAEAVSDSRRRLLAHAMVHLADPGAAARELERASRDLSMTGCMIPTHFPGGDLSDKRYDALWEAAQSLGIPIMLHPPLDGPSGCMFGDTPRFRNLYGRLIDSTIIAAKLILAGVFDRFPKLQLVLVHGGGMLPYQTGRLDGEFGTEKGALPSEYVKRFYYDTVAMSAPALRLLFDLVGASRVMIGSDYAASPAERPRPKLTAALDATGVDAKTRRMVVRETAETIFRTA